MDLPLPEPYTLYTKSQMNLKEISELNGQNIFLFNDRYGHFYIGTYDSSNRAFDVTWIFDFSHRGDHKWALFQKSI